MSGAHDDLRERLAVIERAGGGLPVHPDAGVALRVSEVRALLAEHDAGPDRIGGGPARRASHSPLLYDESDGPRPEQ